MLTTAAAKRLSPPLTKLVETLDNAEGRVPLDSLVRIVGNLELTLADVNDFLHFEDRQYSRNLIHRSDHYELLCLCWKSGQRSPIHDHQGTSCVVRVLKGILTNTDFERVPAGYVKAAGSWDMACGSVEGRQDDEIHQVSNLQPAGYDLITLHVYSPPLTRMNVFTLEAIGSHVEPAPVFTGLHGEGI